MLMGLEQSLAERYATLLSEMTAEQAQAWIETKVSELSLEAEQIRHHAQQQLQREWLASHNNQHPDVMSQVAIHQQADQIAHDTILTQLWEGYRDPEDHRDQDDLLPEIPWTESWPDVPSFPDRQIEARVARIWPHHQTDLDFVVLAESLMAAMEHDGLMTPEQPDDPEVAAIQARVQAWIAGAAERERRSQQLS